MDLNREQKRSMKRMGALNDQGAPVRQARPAVPSQRGKERTSPVQYVREVRDEMRKVAWPHWPEVRRYAIIVLITVVVIPPLWVDWTQYLAYFRAGFIKTEWLIYDR